MEGYALPYSRTVIGRPQLPNHQAVCSSRWAWLRRGHRYLRNAPQSHGAAFLLGQSEEILPGIFPFQLPAPQIEHPISKIRSVPKAVLCHQHGLSALFQLFQDLPELADTLPIQIGGRLVQYKQLRPHGPGAGAGNALFFSTGQSKNAPLQQWPHSADLDGGFQRLCHFIVGRSTTLQPKKHLAGGVQIEELGLGVLKHRTHRPRQFPQRGLCHILAADHNSSRQCPTSSMLEQAIDKLDDCGLAAAALSGEQDKFPRFHRKGAVPKAWRLLALISIGHMVKDNHGSTPLQQIPPTQRAKNSSVTTTSWM